MPLQFLYFDLGHVLLPFSHDKATEQMAAVTGLSTAATKELVFGEEGLEWRLESGTITEDEALSAIAAAGGRIDDPAAIIRANSDIFELNTSIVPLVTSLRCSDHKMGILSNTSAWHWNFVKHKYTVLNLFDTNVLSFEHQAMKPKASIYAHAAERAGVPPENIFFVDDMLPNVEGAIAAGFQAVHYTTATALRNELHDRGVRFNL